MKVKKYEAVIFDLDGTLLNTLEDLMPIVSNKYYEGVQTLKQQYFKDYLQVAVGEREGIRKKPAPDTVPAALKELKVPKEKAVYIGDSEVDIATAANTGMDCII